MHLFISTLSAPCHLSLPFTSNGSRFLSFVAPLSLSPSILYTSLCLCLLCLQSLFFHISFKTYRYILSSFKLSLSLTFPFLFYYCSPSIPSFSSWSDLRHGRRLSPRGDAVGRGRRRVQVPDRRRYRPQRQHLRLQRLERPRAQVLTRRDLHQTRGQRRGRSPLPERYRDHR